MSKGVEPRPLSVLRSSDGWRLFHWPSRQKVYDFSSRTAATRAARELMRLRLDWSFTDPKVCLRWPLKVRLSVVKRLWQLAEPKRTHPWTKQLARVAVREDQALRKEWRRRTSR